mgnify:CR=1 FL=1
MVDKDTSESVTDRPLHHGGRNSRVDAPGEPADRAALWPDLRTDALDLLLNDVDHRPGLAAPRNGVQEVFENLLAVLGVKHFGVPLHASEFALDMLESCHSRPR